RPTYFLQPHPHPLVLHPFPTRRSSDLPPDSCQERSPIAPWVVREKGGGPACTNEARPSRWLAAEPSLGGPGLNRPARPPVVLTRSEEHTSELQSRFDLVCRLLLEKKKY